MKNKFKVSQKETEDRKDKIDMEQIIKVGDIVLDTYAGTNAVFQIRKCDLENEHIKNGYCKILSNGQFPMVMTKEISNYIAQEVIKRSKYVVAVYEDCSNGFHAGGPDFKMTAINQFWLSQNKKEEAYGGYLENTNHVRFWVRNDGSIELVSCGCVPVKKEKEVGTPWYYYAGKSFHHFLKFRKCRVKTVEQAIQKMVEYFDAMWELVEQY